MDTDSLLATMRSAREDIADIQRRAGAIISPPPPPCPTCNGSGRVLEPVETYSFSEYDMCPTCKAKGVIQL